MPLPRFDELEVSQLGCEPMLEKTGVSIDRREMHKEVKFQAEDGKEPEHY
jgi:hypothetical protein